MKSIDSFTGEYEFLRNNYPCSISIAGIEYPSVDHAFQAAKTDDEDTKYEISDVSAREAKRIGRSLTIDSADWDNKKLTVMESLIRCKFEDRDLSDLLFDTGTAEIRMVNDSDRFWGCDEFGSGENHLGKILMKIRNEIAFMAGSKLGDDDGSNDSIGMVSVYKSEATEAQKLYYVLDSAITTGVLDELLVRLYEHPATATCESDRDEIKDQIDAEINLIMTDELYEDLQAQLDSGMYEDY
jgi:hypothetical protein